MLLLSLLSCTAVSDKMAESLDPTDSTEVRVTVPQGTTPRSLARVLGDAGIADSGRFEWYVRLTKEGSCLKAGDFRLSPDMSAPEILEVVCGAPIPDDVPITLVEGWRIREIDAYLAEEGLIEAGDYAALAGSPERFTASFPLPGDSLEGYLFPETYQITPDRFTAEGFIQRQLDTLHEVFVAEAATGERSLHEVVIMASMVEREEPTPKNRPLVAGILWKRIDSEWNLGVDATSRYTLENWNDRRAFLKNLRDPEEPYNTRLRPGLPPTPIGNPGIAALKAAAAPEESQYWYYLHDSGGTLHPTRSAAEHERARKRYNVY